MRTKEILATLAVTGAVATFAVLNVNSASSGKTFLATPITDAEREFISFIAQYRRSYGTKEEYAYRLELFTNTWNTVQEHNSQGLSYTLGINHFSDYSDYERNMMLGYQPRTGARLATDEFVGASDFDVNAAGIDWTTKGAVTGVKNQGSCGSCWSFSTTGALESLWFNKKGSLQSFSEQELIDCSSGYGNLACKGGIMDAAFSYVKDKGLTTEASYPYVSDKTLERGTCASSSHARTIPAGFVKSYTDVTVKNAAALQTALNTQTVSIAIQANQVAFQAYKSGIFTGTCGANLDHGVLAVGYGTEGSKNYWKVKNSWGTTWGENGYIRLDATATYNSGQGQCGILADPSHPNA